MELNLNPNLFSELHDTNQFIQDLSVHSKTKNELFQKHQGSDFLEQFVDQNNESSD